MVEYQEEPVRKNKKTPINACIVIRKVVSFIMKNNAIFLSFFLPPLLPLVTRIIMLGISVSFSEAETVSHTFPRVRSCVQ